MPSRKWARVKLAGAHNLRRGAWYPIVNDSSANIVILDVAKNNVPVPRESLDLADEKPSRWSVVRFDPAKPIPARISQQKLPLTYIVCPHCRERSPVLDSDREVGCGECNRTSEIDWDHPC
jgi:hypothetical protein